MYMKFQQEVLVYWSYETLC